MARLTARQTQCLTLVCRDHLSAVEIADRLSIAPNTVRNHLHAAYVALFGHREHGQKHAIGWACYELAKAERD